MTSKEWKKVKVDKLGIIKTGKTPKTNKKENYGGNIPFLTPTDNMEAKRVAKTIKTLSNIGLEEVKNCLIPQNSICVSCIGSDLGKVVITSEPTVTNQQINSIVIDNKICNVDFVYYSMLQLGKILNYHSKTSTAVPIINKTQFSNYEIKLPPLETQEKIAKALSSLDDKIELNNKINQNLEQQAQAIFNKFFENCQIENKVIGNYLTPKRGKNLLSKDAKHGDIPVIAGGLNPATYHNIANTMAPVITISASGANAGYVNLWHIPVWASDSSYIDSSINPYVYFWYVLLKKRQKEIYDSQTGSAQPHIYPKHIEKMSIFNLNIINVKKYNEHVKPLFETIGNNLSENKRLTQLRDTLLPKLMSGEIDVDDVEV